MVGSPVENVEPLQVVSYTDGQFFNLHHDSGTIDGADALQVEYDPQIAAHQFVSCVLYNTKLDILLAASSIGLLKALKPVT